MVAQIQLGSNILVHVQAELHLFDPVEGVFMLQEKQAQASVYETAEWECMPFRPYLLLTRQDWLSIKTPSKTWLLQRMDPEMNPVFNYVWNI